VFGWGQGKGLAFFQRFRNKKTMIQPVLLRSVLCVPASDVQALARLSGLKMDAVILDLEGALAPEAKAGARENLRGFFKAGPRGSAKFAIRINGFDTEWGSEDFLAARACKPDAIVLPRVEAPQDIQTASDALAETDAPEDLKLWAMIETPRGVMNLAAIAALGAHGKSRLACLVAGTDGLMLETGAKTRMALTPWLSQIVLAGRAGGLAVVDGLFNGSANQDGFEAECGQARDLGFDGKTLIHPNQIEAANLIFAPPLQVLHAEAHITKGIPG
jgi:citrate lyase subunit beta / citryl-CoA lyase